MGALAFLLSETSWTMRILTLIAFLVSAYLAFVCSMIWLKIVRRCTFTDVEIDESLYPSNPTRGVKLDASKVMEVDPFLGGDKLRVRGLQKSLGDGQPAVVTSVEPLRVAAYSDEFDAILTLRFPSTVDTTGLQVGTRLLSATSYIANGPEMRNVLAPDIRPGPAESEMFDNFVPIIVQFVSRDEKKIKQLMDRIPSNDWKRLAELAREAMGRRSGHRDGRPSLVHLPGRLRWWWYAKLFFKLSIGFLVAILRRD